MNPENAIEIVNVSKSFSVNIKPIKESHLHHLHNHTATHTVLNNISLNVKKGDVLGIIGKNGCGKSTLLSIIAKIMDPDSGKIYRAGKIASILELGMGFHQDMSGRENIYLKGEMYGFSKSEMKNRIDKIIDYSGIEEYIDNPVRTYSSGMSGRLAFAIMVNVDSDIMLVDEILSVGDVTFTRKAKEHFKKLAKSGKTVIFVSHSLADLSEMCTRCIWIENGTIIRDGDPKTICNEYQYAIFSSPAYIQDLAEAGVAESQFNLSIMYRDGTNGFDKNLNLYKDWLKKASDQNYVPAQMQYAAHLFSEGGDESEIIDLYRSAAKKGNYEAMLKLSFLENGKGDALEEIIKKIYLEMAETEEPIHQFRCADYILKTAWTDNEKKVAFYWFMKSAEQGFPNALYQVALMYKDGIGVEKNCFKMEEYLKQSADIGYLPSIILLAEIYFEGTILPKNDEKAFKLYLKAAELGNAKSQYQIAVMYRDGVGTDIDLDKSGKWFKIFSHSSTVWNCMWAADWAKRFYDSEVVKSIYDRAAEGGLPSALLNILNIDLSSEIDCSPVISKIELLAEEGNSDAMLILANLYFNGTGVNKCYLKSMLNFKKAAMMGNVWCYRCVGDMYRDGRGVKNDPEAAVEWYKRGQEFTDLDAIMNIITFAQANLIDKNQYYTQALNELTTLANNGVVEAMKKLGNIYYDNIENESDYNKALYWYEKAAHAGDAWCQLKLTEIHNHL